MQYVEYARCNAATAISLSGIRLSRHEEIRGDNVSSGARLSRRRRAEKMENAVNAASNLTRRNYPRTLAATRVNHYLLAAGRVSEQSLLVAFIKIYETLYTHTFSNCSLARAPFKKTARHVHYPLIIMTTLRS